ncbi:Long-chain-fatty-acid--[acyl-carrier-protein] ligase AEE15, chloroplastic, partial [Tetrabaena socialis]
VYSNIRRLRDDLTAHPPDHLVVVPLVLDTLHARVLQRLRAGPPARAAVATALLAAGAAYVRAARVLRGEALTHAAWPPAAEVGGWAAVARWWAARVGAAVAAAAAAAVLAPLHALAGKLVYGKIREALGVRRTVISGGGSLAAHLDDFYEAIGLTVLNGWGLTETSPVLACRRTEPGQNIRGSVGVPTPGTQLRVVHPDSLQPLAEGRQGLVLARGPGVMGGYYRDEAATARAFRAGDGWFDT